MKAEGKPKEVVIHVHDEADEQVVEVSIAGLAESAALAVIERANVEAMKLLTARASRRRFKCPVTIRFFDLKGNVIAKHVGRTHEWGGPERGEPGSIVLEDARGRKASVRVEVTAHHSSGARSELVRLREGNHSRGRTF